MPALQIYEYTGSMTTQEVHEVDDPTITSFNQSCQDTLTIYMYPEYGFAFLETAQHITGDKFCDDHNLAQFIPERSAVHRLVANADVVDSVQTLTMQGRVAEHSTVASIPSSEPIDDANFVIDGIPVQYSPGKTLTIEAENPQPVLDWFCRVIRGECSN